MPLLTTALFALAHVLVFVYWLGGDLGAFYASRYLTRAGVSPDRRLFAAGLVGDIDMAPRTALILTLPTGLALATAKGWIPLSWSAVGTVSALCAAWLGIAWALHLSHGGASGVLKSIDLFFRWALIIGLIGAATGALAGLVAVPLFIAVKLIILAGCVSLGLLIRHTLAPLFPALSVLAADGASREAEEAIRDTLVRARPQVKAIWALLVAAALLGLWAPTGP